MIEGFNQSLINTASLKGPLGPKGMSAPSTVKSNSGQQDNFSKNNNVSEKNGIHFKDKLAKAQERPIEKRSEVSKFEKSDKGNDNISESSGTSDPNETLETETSETKDNSSNRTDSKKASTETKVLNKGSATKASIKESDSEKTTQKLYNDFFINAKDSSLKEHLLGRNSADSPLMDIEVNKNVEPLRFEKEGFQRLESESLLALETENNEEYIPTLSGVGLYLSHIQDKFNLSDKDIEGAIKKLTDDALIGPTEESLNKIVDKIGNISAQDKVVAKSLINEYQFDIQKSGESTLDQSIASEIIPESRLRRAKLNSSIDEMNDRFFVKPDLMAKEASVPSQIKSQVATGEGTKPILSGSELFEGNEPSYDFSPKALNTSPTNIEGVNLNSKNTTQSQMSSSPQTTEELASMIASGLGIATSTDQERGEEGFQHHQNFQSEIDINPDVAETAPEDLSDSFDSMEELIAQPKQRVSTNQTSKIEAQSTEIFGMDSDSQNNVDQIIKEAQLLKKQGGGTMKVQLKPEGLGEIELKVDVNQGRVNVQMMADTPEGKRILESKLSDLKASLIDNKLNVETLRVENLDRSESKGDFSNEFDRDSAREFLQNFRDQNAFNRRGFSLMPGISKYQANWKNGDDVHPDQLDPVVENKKSSRRLDLVA